jgi:hypothetical protein
MAIWYRARTKLPHGKAYSVVQFDDLISSQIGRSQDRVILRQYARKIPVDLEWDTQLSPVDVRRLSTNADRKKQPRYGLHGVAR